MDWAEGMSQPSSHLNYLSKTYQLYVEICGEDLVKALYICRRWAADCQYPDNATVKLFHLYFNVGDYEQALTEFAEISDSYKRTS